MSDDKLVTLPQMAHELQLDDRTVLWLRKALQSAAIRNESRRYAYPRSAVLHALQQRDQVAHGKGVARLRGTPWGTGGFPPADDIVWCPCGKSYIDDQALAAHVERDHGGVAPEQTDTPPLYRYTVEDAADEQAAFLEHRRRIRNYPNTTNRPDAVSA